MKPDTGMTLEETVVMVLAMIAFLIICTHISGCCVASSSYSGERQQHCADRVAVVTTEDFGSYLEYWNPYPRFDVPETVFTEAK